MKHLVAGLYCSFSKKNQNISLAGFQLVVMFGEANLWGSRRVVRYTFLIGLVLGFIIFRRRGSGVFHTVVEVTPELANGFKLLSDRIDSFEGAVQRVEVGKDVFHVLQEVSDQPIRIPRYTYD